MDHPLAALLTGAWLLEQPGGGPAGHMVNAVTGRPLTRGGTAGSSSPSGGITLPDQSSYVEQGDPETILPVAMGTFFGIVMTRSNSDSTGYQVAIHDTTTTRYYFKVLVSPSPPLLTHTDGLVRYWSVPSGWASTERVALSFGYQKSTTTHRVWVNGRPGSNTASSGSWGSNSHGSTIRFGHELATQYQAFGMLSLLYTFNAMFTDQQAHSLWAEPYAMFEPIIRRRYFFPTFKPAWARGANVLLGGGVPA